MGIIAMVAMMPIDSKTQFLKIAEMNNRDYKFSGQGACFHIYNRGNARQDIFLDDADYQFFLLRLVQNIYPDRNNLPRRAHPLPAGSFSLISYCFMPNHFHLLVQQNKEIATGVLIARICTSYSKYFNMKYQRIGHVFQDQFKQKYVSGNQYLVELSAYIHQNPRHAGLVRETAGYRWSSYGEYLANRESEGWCEKNIVLAQYPNSDTYAKFVEEYQSLDDQGIQDLLLDS